MRWFGGSMFSYASILAVAAATFSGPSAAYHKHNSTDSVSVSVEEVVDRDGEEGKHTGYELRRGEEWCTHAVISILRCPHNKCLVIYYVNECPSVMISDCSSSWVSPMIT